MFARTLHLCTSVESDGSLTRALPLQFFFPFCNYLSRSISTSNPCCSLAYTFFLVLLIFVFGCVRYHIFYVGLAIALGEILYVFLWTHTCIIGETKFSPNLGSQVCSDINKPNGQFVLPNSRLAVMTFISSLPIRKVNLTSNHLYLL